MVSKADIHDVIVSECRQILQLVSSEEIEESLAFDRYSRHVDTDEIEVQFEFLYVAEFAGLVQVCEYPAAEAFPVHVLLQIFFELLSHRRLVVFPLKIGLSYFRILIRLRIKIIHILYGNLGADFQLRIMFQKH